MTTTRVGFLIPAVTDNADETLYYANNITILENELPSIISTLPGSGSYTGQVKTSSVTTSDTYSMNYPEANNLWNGTAWQRIGAFGFKEDFIGQSNPGSGNRISSSGIEVFDTAPLPGFNTVTLNPNSLTRFSCGVQITTSNSGGGNSGIFTGKFNIFINPGSQVQPTPTTPGAIRLSFPILASDDRLATFVNYFNYNFGELILPRQASVVTPGTIWGASAYLSTTLTNDTNGTRAEGGLVANLAYLTTIYTERLGQL